MAFFGFEPDSNITVALDRRIYIDIYTLICVCPRYKGWRKVKEEFSVKYSPNNHLSNKSIKNYANITSSIKRPGVVEAGGEVSVCSYPVFTGS